MRGKPEGDLETLKQEAFQREAQRHARLAQKRDDPVARALALGRQALWDLAQGNGEGACQKLSQALELHPFLGGGLAWELARVLCGGARDAASPPLGERRALLREPPPAVRLLAFLDHLPPGFWAEALRGKGEAASRAASSQGDRHQSRPRPGSPRGGERPPSPRRPDRPRLPLVYRPLRRKGPQGKGETEVESLAFLSL